MPSLDTIGVDLLLRHDQSGQFTGSTLSLDPNLVSRELAEWAAGGRTRLARVDRRHRSSIQDEGFQ
jgi:hypothetical protein